MSAGRAAGGAPPAAPGGTAPEERADADPPPVPFSAWLRDAEAALAEERPADVPCGACNACCRTSHFIHVRPEEKRALSRIPRGLLFPAPGLPPGQLVMGYDQGGRCPMFVEGRCSIYDDRPLACRTYDCRIYAAAGVRADRVEIARQVRRWRFAYPSPDDRARHEAAQEAARYIAGHPECLASDAARRDPVRVAVLAVAVHESFLPGGAASPSALAAVALAVRVAHERLFGDL